MKLRLYSTLILALFLLLKNGAAQTQWQLTDNYSIEFTGKKAEGSFSGLSGVIQFDENDLANSHFDVAVDVQTIDTGNSTKDQHAKNEDWFDAITHPRARFLSESIVRNGNAYTAVGTLTIRGLSRQVSIDFEVKRNGSTARFVGSTNLNRIDFGIEGNFFAFMVGDEFEVKIDCEVVKK